MAEIQTAYQIVVDDIEAQHPALLAQLHADTSQVPGIPARDRIVRDSHARDAQGTFLGYATVFTGAFQTFAGRNHMVGVSFAIGGDRAVQTIRPATLTLITTPISLDETMVYGLLQAAVKSLSMKVREETLRALVENTDKQNQLVYLRHRPKLAEDFPGLIYRILNEDRR